MCVFWLAYLSVFAQVPTEQDCEGAIPVCQNIYTIPDPYPYSGNGNYLNEINSFAGCVPQEDNGAWYLFTTQTGGDLSFSITPNNGTDDYDWVVYNLTNGDCSDLNGPNAQSLAVSANTYGTFLNNGPTGISSANGGTGNCNGPGNQNGPEWNADITVQAGNTYVLYVSNWSASTSGYELDFSSSTATLFDNVPPSLDSLYNFCFTAPFSSMKFRFSENVICDSVEIDDFTITGPGGPYTINSVTGNNCQQGGDFENIYTVNFTPTISTPGNYNFNLVSGSGFVEDNCGNVASANSLPFTFNGLTHHTEDTVTIFCSEATTDLVIEMDYPSQYHVFSWAGTGVNDSVLTLTAPIATGPYFFTVTETCSGQSLSITDEVYVKHIRHTADFEAEDQCALVPMAFTDLSTSVNSVPISSWQWDMGNNGTVDHTTQNPNHTFPTPGTFPVRLISTDQSGCSDTIVKNVVVLPGPSIAMNWTDVCIGDSMYFQDQSSIPNDSLVAWQWDFGDGSPAVTDQNPQHLFPDTGFYTVTLTATSDSGCQSTGTQQIEIYKLPEPNFGFTEVCFGDSTPLHDSSTTLSGVVDTWSWDFGDGQTSSAQNPTHLFPDDTVYPVKLLVTSTLGCTDSITKTVETSDLPVVDFVFDNVCQKFSATFHDSSTSGNGSALVSRVWDIYDDGTPESTLPVYTQLFNQHDTVPVQLLVTDAIGCSDSLVKDLLVFPEPEAGFVFINVCLGEPVYFFDTSNIATGLNTQWTWEFGDGVGTDTVQNPVYSYSSAGVYDVGFKVTSDSGCVDSTSGVIQLVVFPFPATDFSADPVCLGDTTFFIDLSVLPFGTIDSAFWHFGEGTANSFDVNTTHVYSNYGFYNVQHFAITDNGCATLADSVIEVYERPNINFIAEDVCFNDSSFFVNQSTMNTKTISAYWWDLGDGTTGTTLDFNHRYLTVDTFAVELRAEADSTGCQDSLTQEIIVYALPGVNFSLNNVCEDSASTFVDLTTAPNLSPQAAWFWDVGNDGSVEEVLQNPQPIFAVPGTFDVELRTVDTLGCTDSLVKPIVVHPGPVVSFTLDSVCFGDSNSFTDQSTIAWGNIVSWTWNFGDGSPTVSTPNTKHLYAQGGQYPVSLTLVSDSGCLGVTSNPVQTTVYPQPTADFDFTNVCVYNQMSFTDQTTLDPPNGTIADWRWRFSDGSLPDANQNPTHKFDAYGYYGVSLVVETPDGCSDSIIQVVQAYEVPDINFVPELICEGDSFQFRNLTILQSDSVFTWNWDFGDGFSSPQEEPKHLYANAQTYNVQLIAVSKNNCIDSLTRTILSNAKPRAQFAYQRSCSNENVPFTNETTISAGQVEGYLWDFGDGSQPDTAFNPLHRYQTGGTYQVSLALVSSAGCVDTARRDVDVRYVPEIEFEAFPILGCAPLPVAFENSTVIGSGEQLTYEWVFEGDTFAYEDAEPLYTFQNRSGDSILFDVTLHAYSPFCQSTEIKVDLIATAPQPTAAFLANPQSVSVFDGTVRFRNRSSTDAVYLDWDFGDGTQDSWSNEVEHDYETAGHYPVILRAENEYGCFDSAQLVVHIQAEATLWVPSAFTPNSDGDNDEFRAYGESVGVDNYSMQVFNRWGERVFEGKSLTDAWNGRMTNGEPAPQGVYVYRITYTDEVDFKEVDVAGSVTLIRNRR